MTHNPFVRASKEKAKLRLALMGPSGSGKTFTALAVGSRLAELSKRPLAVIDTEHGTASKYADRFQFDTVALEAPYHPDNYIELMNQAANAGYGVLVIDSLSHAWNGPGGLLQIVDELAAKMKSGNSFAAWKDATPIHNRLIEALLAAEVHLLVCMRSKTEYVLEQDDKGRNIPRKVGMAPIQRDGLEYEFDVTGELDLQHRLLVDKTRCPHLDGKVIEKPGADLADTLHEWLMDGVEPRTEHDLVRDRWARGLEAAAGLLSKLEDRRGIGAQATKFLGRIASAGWQRESVEPVLAEMGIPSLEEIPFARGFATRLERLLTECPYGTVMETEPSEDYGPPEEEEPAPDSEVAA